jgi:hypothetical protein
MPDDNYDTGSEDESEDSPEAKSEGSDENTALLSKSFFKNKDLKVGDTEKIKILHEYDDEFEVECIYGDKKSKDKESNSNDERSSYMKESESQMDSMTA